MMSSSLCRICLIGEDGIITVRNKQHKEMIEKLLQSKLNSDDGRLLTMCSTCVSQLHESGRLPDAVHKSNENPKGSTRDIVASHHPSVITNFLNIGCFITEHGQVAVQDHPTRLTIHINKGSVIFKKQAAVKVELINEHYQNLEDFDENTAKVETHNFIESDETIGYNENWYNCDVCNGVKNSKDAPATHYFKYHTGEKPLPCSSGITKKSASQARGRVHCPSMLPDVDQDQPFTDTETAPPSSATPDTPPQNGITKESTSRGRVRVRRFPNILRRAPDVGHDQPSTDPETDPPSSATPDTPPQNGITKEITSRRVGFRSPSIPRGEDVDQDQPCTDPETAEPSSATPDTPLQIFKVELMDRSLIYERSATPSPVKKSKRSATLMPEKRSKRIATLTSHERSKLAATLTPKKRATTVKPEKHSKRKKEFESIPGLDAKPKLNLLMPPTEYADAAQQPPTEHPLQMPASPPLSPAAYNPPSPSVYFECGDSSESSPVPSTLRPSKYVGDLYETHGFSEEYTEYIFNLEEESVHCKEEVGTPEKKTKEKKSKCTTTLTPEKKSKCAATLTPEMKSKCAATLTPKKKSKCAATLTPEKKSKCAATLTPGKRTKRTATLTPKKGATTLTPEKHSKLLMKGKKGLYFQSSPESKAKPNYFECGGSSDSSPVPQTPQSSTRVRNRFCSSDENIFNFGSEDESEDDDNDFVPPPFIPRAARVFLEPEEDPVHCEDEDGTNLVLQWPPLLPPAPAFPVPDSSPIGASMPNDLFHFDWRAFPDSPIPPAERRETFSIKNGPTATYGDPYGAFSAIWDRPIMEHIASETNRYAQQYKAQLRTADELQRSSRITKWVDTDADELYRYFAIILATGIVVRSRFEEYWNTSQNIFSTPGFSAEMPINRFLLLTRCLHFNDNLALKPEASYEEVKLHKLKPLIDHLNNTFQKLYVLGQNVALDESLTQWKGWLQINQFIKNKAARVGIKTYELCDSQTGYLWRFNVHTGSGPVTSNEAGPFEGKIPKLVIGLTDDLKNSGRTLWMDNFYNSPSLARTLKSNGLDCVGTLRANRKFVPGELSTLTHRDMAMGQLSGCTSGDLDLLVWRDNRIVTLISTYHGATITSHDSRLKPTVVQDYNHYMGGVDKKDQMLAMYPIERKRTKVWYKKFFRRLLNASVLNSYILYNHPNSARSSHMNHRAFRINLILRILEVHQRLHGRNVPLYPRQRWLVPRRPLESSSPHVWQSLPFRRASDSRHIRRQCAQCKKRTTRECADCAKPFCPPCFTIIHGYIPQ